MGVWWGPPVLLSSPLQSRGDQMVLSLKKLQQNEILCFRTDTSWWGGVDIIGLPISRKDGAVESIVLIWELYFKHIA